ncbi:MAG: alpha-L-fucosidase [Armatimonadia bacterium]|nr:alpha-L-fucosidase [Armatimonadia bacterium]
MKRMIAVLVLALAAAVNAEPPPPYEPTWESLTQHPVPEWFQDAKFGIYAHWGPYSVPAFGNEWYPRNMYQEGSATQRHHIETYGPLSEFGYKNFIPQFTAASFDADEWAELFLQSGAKFAGPVAEHHDGFSMWDSEVNRWNAADMGPRRDVVGELVAAVRGRGMKVVTSFHHAFNIQGYYAQAQDWDTTNPEYRDLYGQFDDPAEAYGRWLTKLKEVIDAYQPDQIWFDFGLADVPDDYKQRMAAYYYNMESEWGKPVIITRKGDHLPQGVGVLDIERAKMERPAEQLWQTDDSVAVNSWSWVEGLQLKTAEELVHELIDIVSKNGVLLLNVAPKADGTIPEDQRELLLAMGRWLEVNGEAIYGTRPWAIHGEGPRLYDEGRGFHRDQIDFSGEDVRFTTKAGTFYAIFLGWPGETVTLRNVHADQVAPGAEIALLGHGEALDFDVDDGQLTASLPNLPASERPCEHAFVLRLEGLELSLSDAARFAMPSASVLTAEQAVIDGDQARTEERDGRTNIGFWDDPSESLHWLARIPEPGEYLLQVETASVAASGLTIECEVGSVDVDVPATGGWDAARLIDGGSLTFAEPGIYHLEVRPSDVDAWSAINLWQVRLAPVG